MQWLLPRVPGGDVRLVANKISALSRWKIFDNLRRSLVPLSLMLLMLGAWLIAPELGSLGLLLVISIVALPGLLSAFANRLRKPADLPMAMHLSGLAASVGRQLGQAILTLAFLPYDALVSMDAIGRTLLRLLVTQRRLLEWQTSSDSEGTSGTGLAGYYAKMWIAPIAALTCEVLLFLLHPTLLYPALPVLGLWLAAPWMAWWISEPTKSAHPDLTMQQLAFLRRTARRTWSYFEAFVTGQENWLPPDNFQELSAPTIAARTSPTNMGLALLANLAAWDFGYLSAGGLVRRTRDALATMQGLERHRGHFYNWYATRTLQPLLPLYVSSVDSGNLAGHLLTLSSGLREMADERIFTSQTLAGLRDTLRVLSELTPKNSALASLDAQLQSVPSGLRGAFALLEGATDQAAAIAASLSGEAEEVKRWAQALLRDCREHLEDMLFLAPWLALPTPSRSSGGGTPPPVHRVAPARGPCIPTPVDDGLLGALDQLDRVPTLRGAAEMEPSVCPITETASKELQTVSAQSRQGLEKYLADISSCLREGGDRARRRLDALEALAKQAEELAAMDFTFLFDRARNLFSTGFNVAERRCDTSFYDLLASEARLCSYVAIATGQVPQDHWFSLGRLLVASRGGPILVSWSGSMFEYLMPLLVMPNYENTLLDHTCRAAVQRQIEYGRLRGVPWGISESGYNRTDVNLNYQYRAFGVPGLGLKRGLAGDLVIAPYAAAMALMVAPVEACENLLRLATEGRAGTYGFFEAVDYTPMRLPPDESSVTVRSFMAHHQGMSLLAIDYLLRDHPMQRRFMTSPLLRAADLLLQERVPKTAVSVFPEDLVLETARSLYGEGEGVMRVFTDPSPPAPEVHLLSNGRYHVALSSAGGGYSRWRDLAVTRWREDSTRDCWGMFVYLRDVATGDYWSAAYQPVLRETQGYEAIFTQARAEFRQRHGSLDIHTEISVSPEDDVELRRITITNHSAKPRVIELTSYAEVVLAPAAADAAHPAFSNLFVQTEFEPRSSAILCSRRARSEEEKPPWLLHVMVGGGGLGEVSCETDRCRFVGRGGTPANPLAMQRISPLSNTVGPALDPIISLRRTISVAPDETASVDLVLGVTESRESALAQVDKYQMPRMVDRAFDLAWTHSQVTLRHLNATEGEAQLYGRLAGALIYADPARRASPAVLRSNRRGQSGLWSYGISGDSPIVLIRVSDPARIEIVQQLIRAHSYWRLKGLTVELVIVNEDVSVYRQSLHDQITRLISSGIEEQMLDKPGGIFVRRLEQISSDDRVLLQSVARIVLDDESGTLAEQMEGRIAPEPTVPALSTTRAPQPDPPKPASPRELILQNGLGGFTRD
ncbi:MAG TPA: glucoamylase family protein, partial [Opitutaceae bacterium]|nr:glucoamylase family protein [Opitutaceae bacterium]